MKIAIVGAAGRMGKKLIELAAGEGLEVVSKVDVAEGYEREWSRDVEGVIDFSFHAGVPAFVTKAAEQGIPYVIGTTGITAEEQVAVDAAAKKIPVVQSGNYSLGVNLLIQLVKEAAQILDSKYDVEVVEMHHKHKKDAPSGTALMLARAAAEGRSGKDYASPAESPSKIPCVAAEAELTTGDAESHPLPKFVYGRQGETGERPEGDIAIHALRGGSVVGDHTVMFAGDLERVEITHKAQDRAAFAAGALRALKWAAGKSPAIYNMRHVLGFEG